MLFTLTMSIILDATSADQTKTKQEDVFGDDQKLRISGVALIPFFIALAVVMCVVYAVKQQPLLQNAGFDALLWVGAAAVFYLASLGLMYVPWSGL